MQPANDFLAVRLWIAGKCVHDGSDYDHDDDENNSNSETNQPTNKRTNNNITIPLSALSSSKRLKKEKKRIELSKQFACPYVHFSRAFVSKHILKLKQM